MNTSIRPHLTLDAFNDTVDVRVDTRHVAARLDLHDEGDLLLWFDHDDPGRLVAISLTGATTVWPDQRVDDLRQVIGDEIADAVEHAAAHNLASHTPGKVVLSAATMDAWSAFHRRYRAIAGDPVDDQPTAAERLTGWIRGLFPAPGGQPAVATRATRGPQLLSAGNTEELAPLGIRDLRVEIHDDHYIVLARPIADHPPTPLEVTAGGPDDAAEMTLQRHNMARQWVAQIPRTDDTGPPAIHVRQKGTDR